MAMPSFGSTVAFVAIVLVVCFLFVLGVRYGSSGDALRTRRRRVALAVLGVGAVLMVSAVLAEIGAVRALAGKPAFMLFPGLWVGLALAVALSPLGRQMAQHLPIAALVGFQAFRLPLELVLHRWFEEGVIPVQMTYSGHNFDIVTGALAVVVALGSWMGKLPRAAVWAFNLIGLGLLVTVVGVAVLSSPVPIRTYLDEPTVLLAFHAPYVWIISICVAGALLGHVVTFQWLLRRVE
jgi:hypothetical protein